MGYSDQLEYVIDALMDIKSILDRRRHIMYLQFTNIIEIYKTSKCYVPALCARVFQTVTLILIFDYYHYILEVRYILLTQKTTLKASLR